MLRKIKIIFVTTLLSELVLSGCATNAVTGRSQFNMVSEQAAINNGKEGYSKIISKYREGSKLITSGDTVERVTVIANRLIDQAVKVYPNSVDWEWEIQVLDDQTPNAWCLPGGKMAIHTGIIDKLSLNDNEIAAIIGHEIAHALVGHGAERQSIQMASGLATALIAVALGQNNEQREAIYSVTSVASALAITLPYSRNHESEADRVGIEIAARAGFDPGAAVSLWQKMGKHTGGSGGSDFFSTHPSSKKRQDELSQLEPYMRPLMTDALAQGIDLSPPNPWIVNSSNKFASFSRNAYLRSIAPLQLITHVNQFQSEQEKLVSASNKITKQERIDPQTARQDTDSVTAVSTPKDLPLLDIVVLSSGGSPSAALAVAEPKKGSQQQLEVESSIAARKTSTLIVESSTRLSVVSLSCDVGCTEMSTINASKLRYAIESSNWMLVYQTIAKMNTRSDSAYFWLGKSALELGNPKLAIGYFTKAQEMSDKPRFACDQQGLLPCYGANIKSQSLDALNAITTQVEPAMLQQTK